MTTSRWRRGLLALAVAGTAVAPTTEALASEALASSAPPPTNAVCSYELTGTNDDPRSYLAVEPSPATLEMEGTISCSGTWRGQPLDPTPGPMRVFDGHFGPIGTALGGASCTWGDDNLQLEARLPRQGRDLRLSGTMRFTRLVYWSTIDGDLGGQPYVGYAGVGAAPDEPDGTCVNPDDPFHHIAVAGRFVVGDPSVGAADHRVAVVGLQYVPSGTVGAPTQSPTRAYDQPVLKGDRITWTNLDQLPHTVTSCAYPCLAPYPSYPQPSGTFYGELTQLGDQFSLDTAALAPGKYSYYCQLHKYMRGSFEVMAV